MVYLKKNIGGRQMNKNIRFITRTAILLAIAILFQFLGKFMGPQNNFIVGPIVNAVLLISTEIVGVFSGLAISIIAPLVSAITNKSAMAPVVLAFSPFIIMGNAVLVLCYYFLRKWNKIVAVVIGAFAKFAFLFASITIFSNLMKANLKIPPVFIASFTWPQLVTALIGGIIALLFIIPAIRKAVKD